MEFSALITASATLYPFRLFQCSSLTGFKSAWCRGHECSGVVNDTKWATPWSWPQKSI